MTTPIRGDVGDRNEAMRNSMIDLLVVLVLSTAVSIVSRARKEATNGFSVRFGNTFRDDLLITILVTGVFTVLALHSCTLE